MDTTLAEYTIGDTLGDLAIYWQADDGSYRDFATGWTFEVKVGDANGTRFTLDDNITGADGSATTPSITVAWSDDDLGAITSNRMLELDCQVRAVRDADGKTLTKKGVVRLLPALA